MKTTFISLCQREHLKLNANLRLQMVNYLVLTRTFVFMAPRVVKLNIWYVQSFHSLLVPRPYAMMALCFTQELPTDKTSVFVDTMAKILSYLKLFNLSMFRVSTGC